MLRISLENFKCWTKLSVEIPIGTITLIKGASGSGKTTILQAIVWCLYGNIRSISPNSSDSNRCKTKVIIQSPSIKIVRQRNPGRLIVSRLGNDYEDKVAQEVINDLFGSYDVWMASCYVGQGCRNTFLTSPNSGKLELLNSIAFYQEDPSAYLEKIDELLITANRSYDEMLDKFERISKEFRERFDDVDINWRDIDTESLIGINKQLEKEIGLLEAEKQQRLVNIELLSSLKLEQRRLKKEITDKHVHRPLMIPDSNDVKLITENMLELYSSAHSALSNIMKLESQLPKIPNNIDLSVTQEDYERALEQEIRYQDNNRIVLSFGIPYKIEDIERAIENRESTLSHQQHNLSAELLSELEKKKRDMVSQAKKLIQLPIPEIIRNEIAPPDLSSFSNDVLREELSKLQSRHGELKAKINHAQSCLDILLCPHCQGGIRIQKGTLMPADSKPVEINEVDDLNDQVSEIVSEISSVNRSIKENDRRLSEARSSYDSAVRKEENRIAGLLSQKQYAIEENERRRQLLSQHEESIKNIIDDMEKIAATIPSGFTPKKPLTQREIIAVEKQLNQLKSVVFIDSPSPSSETIKSKLATLRIMEQRKQQERNIEEMRSSIPITFKGKDIREINEEIRELKRYYKYLTEVEHYQDLLGKISDRIAIVESSIGDDPSPQIMMKKGIIEENKVALDNAKRARLTMREYEKILRLHGELEISGIKVGDLRTLKQYAVEAESKLLQQIVGSINDSIEDVCSNLFDREIAISLNLFKTTKTTKITKPSINFTVSYQGGSYDNINQLSGGEGDRASLALTLALGRLSDSPLLIFDESLGSIDLTMKESAIHSIRENTDKTVLIVMHDGIEGLFDHVIDVEMYEAQRQ